MKSSEVVLAQILFDRFPDLRGFMGARQAATLYALLNGGKSDRVVQRLTEFSERIKAMPVGTGPKSGCTAYLRYSLRHYEFLMTAKDPGAPGDGPEEFQSQAYGCARFHPHKGELGYVSLPEIFESGAELDLQFTPMPLEEARTD